MANIVSKNIDFVFTDTGVLVGYQISPGHQVTLPTTEDITDARAYADSLAANYEAVMTNDVKELIGEGAPVDYAAGPPVVGTGVATAGPGSRYTDITNAKLYINGGTKAQPVWKIVTSAA